MSACPRMVELGDKTDARHKSECRQPINGRGVVRFEQVCGGCSGLSKNGEEIEQEPREIPDRASES